jgi:HK97 family phage prohead protease
MNATEEQLFADFMLAREEQNTEAADRPFLVREFVAADVAVEGRTVDVRLVPFGEVARVADPPDWREYSEEWLPGVFDHQLNAANRIHAKYGHSQSVVDVVGHGITLRSEADGYHIATKMHQTLQGETALELIRDGALPCVSLEARPVKSQRTTGGVMQRVKAHLTGFAFCRQGAFAGAQVLALREQQNEEEVIDADLLPVEPDPELIARCQRLGIKLPQRYQAQPASTDTSDESDTSADGTRQSPETTDFKEQQ